MIVPSLARLQLPPEDYRSTGPWTWMVRQFGPDNVAGGRAATLDEAVADLCYFACQTDNHVAGIVDGCGSQVMWQIRLPSGWTRVFMTDEVVAVLERDVDGPVGMVALACEVAESRVLLAQARGEL